MQTESQTYTLHKTEVPNLHDFINTSNCELGGYAKEFTSSDKFSIQNENQDVQIKLVHFDNLKLGCTTI